MSRQRLLDGHYDVEVLSVLQTCGEESTQMAPSATQIAKQRPQHESLSSTLDLETSTISVILLVRMFMQAILE